MDTCLKKIRKTRKKNIDDGLVECCLWDFTDQRDFYLTNWTLLNPDAIYIIVANISEDITDNADESIISNEGKTCLYNRIRITFIGIKRITINVVK